MDGSKPPERASVVDVGSNSAKLVNYVLEPGGPRPYRHESVRTRLGDGLRDGAIREQYVDAAIDALRYFRNIVDYEGAGRVVAVATSAVRDASNGPELVRRAREEAGFDVAVLSEREEALYSYAGAARALELPGMIFFDLGGGSLEMVSAEDFRIRKITSLPLGSLRLTRRFPGAGQLREMAEYAEGLLPGAGDLGAGGPVLVGVGGSLRAVARHVQARSSYPLQKIHNYRISLEQLESAAGELLPLGRDELEGLGTMGGGRSETVKAGLTVVTCMVKKLGLDGLVVSAQGLREGALALSLLHPGEFASRRVAEEHVRDAVRASCRPAPAPEYSGGLARLLSSEGLVPGREGVLLAHAMRQLGRLSQFRGPGGVLHAVLDDDSPLTHREQLVVALSIIHSRRRRRAESLVRRFGGVLEGRDGGVIRRVAAAVSLCDIFERTRTAPAPAVAGGGLVLEVRTADPAFPALLLDRACRRAGESLGVPVRPVVRSGEGPPPQQAL